MARNNIVARKIAAFLLAILALQCFATADDHLHLRPEYTLHTGDVITLSYRLTPEFDQTVTVQPDGCVNLQIAGNVKVEGLTIEAVHDQVVKLASVRLNNPELNISLKQFEQPYVVVAGEVLTPGKIGVRENTTALEAIMLAGGFKDSAKDTHVLLFRHINGDMAEVRELNLHNITKNVDLERDTDLQPGDMLLVTRNKLEHLSRFMKASNLGVYFNPFAITAP